MAQNLNVRMPPFLPTVPLPVGMVGQGMMYMYSCSQCDFKTHIEAMFKQHVDSVHLGLRYEVPWRIRKSDYVLQHVGLCCILSLLLFMLNDCCILIYFKIHF